MDFHGCFLSSSNCHLYGKAFQKRHSIFPRYWHIGSSVNRHFTFGRFYHSLKCARLRIDRAWMKKYVSFVTGFLAIGIEIFVFLALMELPPFHKGDSDILWGLPFFCIFVLGLAIPGLVMVLTLKKGRGTDGFILLGLILNGLSLAIPFLLILLAVIRAFL